MSFSSGNKANANKSGIALPVAIILVLSVLIFIIVNFVQTSRIALNPPVPAAESTVILPSAIIEEDSSPYLINQIPPMPTYQELEERIIKADENRVAHAEEVILVKSQIKKNAISARMELDEAKNKPEVESAQVANIAAATTNADPFIIPKTPLPTREERKKMEARGIISF